MGVVVVVVLVPVLLSTKIISSVGWSEWAEFFELLALCFHFAAEIPETTTLVTGSRVCLVLCSEVAALSQQSYTVRHIACLFLLCV